MTADRTGGGPDVRVSGEDCPQPPDAKFWTVHVHGPDDVIPFDTEDEAECYAAAITDLTKSGGALHPSSPLSPVISAHVIAPADPVVSPVQGEAVEVEAVQQLINGALSGGTSDATKAWAWRAQSEVNMIAQAAEASIRLAAAWTSFWQAIDALEAFRSTIKGSEDHHG